jgi:nucleoside-diphosphate-sugar epimerase
MKIFITGGTGFLGSNLAYALKNKGHDVTIIGRNSVKCDAMASDGFNVICADLLNEQVILDCTKEHEMVFHCAALSSPWGHYDDFYKINVLGTENIIASCKKNNVRRFVHVSTPSIYFEYKNKKNIKETDPLPIKQVNNYSKTKLIAESRVDAAAKSGLEVITIRPRGIFGPGDTSIIPRLICAHDRKALPLFNGGKTILDMTFVDNVTEALMKSIDAPQNALGCKFNITNDQPMPLFDLLELLFSKLGKKLKTRNVSFKKAFFFAQLFEAIYQLPFIHKEPRLTRYTVGLLAFDQTLDI